jgi:hypothetical protein
MANPNYQLLVEAAKLLRPILGELVFVGGCTTGLLITDKAAADVRPTYDVDAIAEITSYMEYTEFSERLKGLGFQEDTREGASLPLAPRNDDTGCDADRWKDLLGFKNTWYRPAMETAEQRENFAPLEFLPPILVCHPQQQSHLPNHDCLGNRSFLDLQRLPIWRRKNRPGSLPKFSAQALLRVGGLNPRRISPRRPAKPKNGAPR